MNKKAIKLSEILLDFPEDAFYTCTCDHGGIKMQGTVSSPVIRKAIELGYTSLPFDEMGWVQFQKDEVNITLT